uniref:HTH CENPB-type domain-containing protein n=1 Tax=Phytophthora ramorum TaxID=164328 RepID=H3HDC6_PHYRM
MESSTRKVTRAHLTLHQKAQLRAFLAANPNLPQFAVADWVREHFHVRLGRTTLYRIQSAPEGAFTTGNLSRKKLRRVKYPDFEQQLLDFYLERRERKEDVSDDLLMRKAAECRAACGISDVELKLSNGWLYRFKIRHQLNNAPGFLNWEPVGEMHLEEFAVVADVGQCGDPARVQNNVASSMWVEISLTCDRQSILKVEVLTPGYALTDSSVVLRRIQ